MKNSMITLTIESLAYGGDGVGHLDGRVVFVPDGVPGDETVCRITEDRGSFLRAEIESITLPSENRVERFCPLADRCGGCQWQAVSYPSQLVWKETIVRENLRRIGGVVPEVEACVPCADQRAFRTVARYPCRMTGDGLVMGYHERRSRRIVDIDTCPVAVDGINRIAASFRKCANELPGSMPRELTIRCSRNEQSAIATLVAPLNDDTVALIERFVEDAPGLDGLVHRTPDGKPAGTCGETHRVETVAGRTFRIEERSFFQTNTVQAETLAATVTYMLGATESDTVVDGYGGVGLLAFTAVPVGAGIHLYDTSRSAVRDSKANAKTNGYERFTAHEADTVKAAAQIGSADLLILDPPRNGLDDRDVEAAAGLGARTIVYVSCDPSTFARDAERFAALGYPVERVTPVDMFPHTFHIELAAKLVRRQEYPAR